MDLDKLENRKGNSSRITSDLCSFWFCIHFRSFWPCTISLQPTPTSVIWQFRVPSSASQLSPLLQILFCQLSHTTMCLLAYTVCPYELLKQIAFLLYNVLKLTAAATLKLQDSTLKQSYKYSLSWVCARSNPVFAGLSVAFAGSREEVHAAMVPGHQRQHLGSWQDWIDP